MVARADLQTGDLTARRTPAPSAAPRFASLVRDVADFPTAGVVFKDITPALADAEAPREMVDGMAAGVADLTVDLVVGIEARGFLVAAPLAYRIGAGLTLVRKAGKLPSAIEHESYALEYGDDRLEIHADAIRPGERVLVVDDVLATGGTAGATVRLVERLGGQVMGLSFLIELSFLGGRSKLADRRVDSLVVT
ncbi:MAG TPA: adenine phosphoribosyltransferase [Acidimicrobiales bacterium]